MSNFKEYRDQLMEVIFGLNLIGLCYNSKSAITRLEFLFALFSVIAKAALFKERVTHL